MGTTSRQIVAIDETTGLEQVVPVDADIFGTGTVAERPVSGTSDGDIYVVQDPGLGIFRIDVWNGGAWESTAGSGTGVTESQHKVLRQLIHFIDDGPACGFASGAFKEILPTGPFPTSYIWWTDSGKTDKIVELTVTRNAGKFPTVEKWEVYDTDGSTVLCTVTDAITYSGAFEASRTRTIA